MTPEEIVKRPLIFTEKGNTLREEENQYLFEVARTANKAQIRSAIEDLFDVRVEKVRTMIIRGRMRRMGRTWAKTQNWKKAIVSLKEGESIDFFEGA
ncbi:MAG: 50S ribosomal protein L23 [Myxococcales bacterium]|nr:50S ribosomal protein L23 [Myxococcales bacterium]MDD9966099.1 50S ribosomal protein L23 [Myxococcales bacterium]